METLNYKCYVSLEIANLLKEAGFDWPVNSTYRDGVLMYQRNLLCDNFNGKRYENAARYEFFSAPTLEVAQRWLREVKGVHIEITFGGKWIYTPYNLTNLECLLSEDEFPETRNYNTYEEAQEAGIKKALRMVLEKG